MGRSHFYGPGTSQWYQDIWVKKWSHGPPGIPAYGSIQALGDCNSPHGLRTAAYGPYRLQTIDHHPRTIGHSKDQKRSKKAKKALIPKMIKNGHSDFQKPIFRPNLKDNGDKPPPWGMPKFNQDEEDPRGPTG
ncbi:hypothetical protein O181_125971 [Austropuccinia psidii MF-1]|uniref:Uncharacterized protein n=1 Tax=Austropuccinia psidii MF-1 TaxID=1389203 RepID=A0A9Q3KU75_9BASI|nr:hypothetical protein [Austropuccinia psidii MF-1]